MTGVAIKDIKGALVKELELSIESADLTHQDAVIKDLRKQIKKLGAARIGMDREKLAEILSQHIYGKKELQYPLSDAIIANLKDLLEAKMIKISDPAIY